MLLFFQAEDGIRAFHVTGVQTCALPISGMHVFSSRLVSFTTRSSIFMGQESARASRLTRRRALPLCPPGTEGLPLLGKIGRASGRQGAEQLVEAAQSQVLEADAIIVA